MQAISIRVLDILTLTMIICFSLYFSKISENKPKINPDYYNQNIHYKIIEFNNNVQIINVTRDSMFALAIGKDIK